MKITKKIAQGLILKRNNFANKSDYGHLMIIAGSKQFLGAGILSGLAATRSGVGYTHLMSEINSKARAFFPDFIIHTFDAKNLKNKENYSFAIGPGLGTSTDKKKLFLSLYKCQYKNVVVDADALSILSKLKIKLPSTWILTPHEGEAAKLLGVDVKQVKKSREVAAKKIHDKFGCHVMLKGPETIVVDCQREIFKMSFGNPALAKAGSGDVLTGLIGSQLAQGLNPLQAIVVANFLHGEAANRYLKKGYSMRSLRPTDLIEEISKLLKKFD